MWKLVKSPIERVFAQKEKKKQYFSIIGYFGKYDFQSPEKPKLKDYNFYNFGEIHLKKRLSAPKPPGGFI